jgi:hypothetical protein
VATLFVAACALCVSYGIAPQFSIPWLMRGFLVLVGVWFGVSALRVWRQR